MLSSNNIKTLISKWELPSLPGNAFLHYRENNQASLTQITITASHHICFKIQPPQDNEPKLVLEEEFQEKSLGKPKTLL